MSEPEDLPPGKKQTLGWPVGVNLTLLLLIVFIYDIDAVAFFGFLLALLNGVIGFVFLLFERRRDAGYAGGFFLSFLLLLIIGFGLCSRQSSNGVRVEAAPVPATDSIRF